MKKLFKTKANLFTLYGALFGLIFPIVSTLFDAFLKFSNVGINSIITVQSQNPMLWVIDSAPLWLGLFARIAGIKQDVLNASISELESINDRLISENEQRGEIEEQLRKKNMIMEYDLESARIMQKSFLPAIPDYKHLDIDFKYIPMKKVGGDYLSIINLKESGLGVFIADVSGHGVSASLITSLIKISSDRACHNYGLQPHKFMDKLNKELINALTGDHLVTALYGLFHEKKDGFYFTYARAAHPHPIIWRSNDRKAELLDSHGVPIGFDENSEFEEISIQLHQGDQVYLFTDGILETRNMQDSLLEFDGLADIIKKANNQNSLMNKKLDLIMEELELFRGGQEVKDDRVIIGSMVKQTVL